jgi:hypothetical protein
MPPCPRSEWPYDSCFRAENNSPYELVYTGESPGFKAGSNQICMQFRVARVCDGLGSNTGPGICCAALAGKLWKVQMEVREYWTRGRGGGWQAGWTGLEEAKGLARVFRYQGFRSCLATYKYHAFAHAVPYRRQGVPLRPWLPCTSPHPPAPCALSPPQSSPAPAPSLRRRSTASLIPGSTSPARVPPAPSSSRGCPTT